MSQKSLLNIATATIEKALINENQTSKYSKSSTTPSLKAIVASETDFVIASNVRPPSIRRP